MHLSSRLLSYACCPKFLLSYACCLLAPLLTLADIDLNGLWRFSFAEGQRLETTTSVQQQEVIPVPGCWDTLPRWYLKRGTGLYQRPFSLATPMTNAVLVVDGMGVRARFTLDGRDLGLFVTPYARLEIPVGPLSAGDHTLDAAVDNTLAWPEVKLARPYYDFYFYGGFYHGVRLVEKAPKIFVRTLDYHTGKVEVEIEGGTKTVRTIPGFKLWSPEDPNLTTLTIAGRKVCFGIRQIEAKNGKLFLNGKPLFLKGFNRHESSPLEGAATSEATMLRDLQNLKAVGGNFIRGAHYQQCERFLDLCDEMGVLVWEESLGWGNGQPYDNDRFPPNELTDSDFRRLQIAQTRDMVRTSFNHPSVIIQGFLNECDSTQSASKTLVDELIATIRAERPNRLVSFACNRMAEDICCSNVDIVAFNAYPGTIAMEPGTPAELKKKVADCFNSVVKTFRARYPEKPIMISESGCGGLYGRHDPHGSINTEEFQEEYLRDILETLWTNKDVSGFAIWQMNDGRTRERDCARSCSAMFGGSIAGCFDDMRRPKKSVATVKAFFERK